MKWHLWAFIIIAHISMPAIYSQTKYWELKQGELEKNIKMSDVIISGTVRKKNASVCSIRVSKVFQGPQRLRAISIQFPQQESKCKPGITYIFFLKRKGNIFSLLPGAKSVLKLDMFLSSRVRKETMNWRVERATNVLLGTVEAVKETNRDNAIVVKAVCKPIHAYKGITSKNIVVEYTRIHKPAIPMVLLFEQLNYIFFLKKLKKAGHYRLLNEYEGAYLENRLLIEDVKLATRIENRFDKAAGKITKGLQAFAQAPNQASPNSRITVKMLLQNKSKQPLEIYHNQILYFTLFHVVDENGKSVPIKYPRKNSVPPIHTRYFITLAPEEYIIMPDIDLSQFCRLKTGSYSIYFEFHLPWEYAGKTLGKSAWSGSVMSNKIQLTITE